MVTSCIRDDFTLAVAQIIIIAICIHYQPDVSEKTRNEPSICHGDDSETSRPLLAMTKHAEK